MTDFFFSGSHDGKLDDKNRFVLPQTLRYGLVENGKLEFTMGLGLGGCICVYKQSDIIKIVNKFRKNQHIAKFQKFFTLFFSTLHTTTCDKIGRVSVPQRLMKAVNLKKQIVIAGVLDKIEIWPQENYEKDLNNLLFGKDKSMNLSTMTEEAFSLLHEKEDEQETSPCSP